MSGASINLRGVQASFGKVRVLRGIDLSVQAGSFVALLGSSGCGKTTLLRTISGFKSIDQGEIEVNGKTISALPPERRGMAMVFQSYALWPHMTVAKNVAFGLEERKIPRAEISQRVMEALELVDLVDYAQRRPSQLSGGQQQRVALARTIVIQPRVLLLDEPLSNLDANLRVQMRRDILSLQRKLNLTTVFVTHDQEEANTTSQRMAVLNNGILQQIGAPMELYDNPVNTFVAGFLGTANIMKGAVKSDGGETRFVSANGLALPLVSTRAGMESLAIRPQNIHLRPRGQAGSEAMSGQVTEVEFLGSILRYAAHVDGETLLVDHSHTPGEHVFAAGDEVDVVVEADQFIML